jgi:hypothetical protein
VKAQIGKLTILVTLVLSILLLPQLSSAASNSLGISPPSIRNTMLLPGSRYEQEIVLSRSEPESMAIANITLEGDLADWISFSPSNQITMPQGEQRVTIKAIVNIPQDAILGEYIGTAYVKLQDPNATGQVILAPAVAIDINLKVGTESYSILKVLTAEIPDSYKNGDIILNLKVSNEGNAPKALSKVTLKFMDMTKKELKTYQTSAIQETSSFSIEEQTIIIPDQGLELGEYFVEVEAFDGDNSLYKDTLVFNVLEQQYIPAPEVSETPSQTVDSTKVITSTVLMVCGALLISWVLLYLFLMRKKKEDKSK